MRIIDNKKDYYDYLQDSTDTLVFDRRNSFNLSKSTLCSYFNSVINTLNSSYGHMMIQCGATFWIFLVTVSEVDECRKIKDFDLELLATWKDYSKDINILKISTLEFMPEYLKWDYKSRKYILLRDKIDKEKIIKSITNMDRVRSVRDIGDTYYARVYMSVSNGHFPILASSGIASMISPLDIFCAIEEYFSLKKTESERTEAIGATNDDKIVMHGFDTKTSFRGK